MSDAQDRTLPRVRGLGVTGERPVVIGISCDVVYPPDRPESLRASCPLTYARAASRAVEAVGGVVVLLPPLVEQIPAQLALCDAFVLIGGDDPRTEPFGEPTHPKASCVHPARQEYDAALLRALRPSGGSPATPGGGAAGTGTKPVLGVCLGMQMMALVNGGRLDQHLPDVLASAGNHAGDRTHRVEPVAELKKIDARAGGFMGLRLEGSVTSHHHQGVRDAGRLSVVARSPDGVIEAIADPSHPFYLGVQWHPERTKEPALGEAIFQALVEAARACRNQAGRVESADQRGGVAGGGGGGS